MRKLIVTTIILVFCLFNSFSQEAGWYLEKPIVDIEFIGLENVSEGELEGIKTQFIGKPFTEAVYLDLQTKLFALNYFEDFQAAAVPGDKNDSSVIVQFTLVERPLVDSIEFQGNSRVRNREIEDTIITKVDDILNNARIRLDSTAVKELYISKGFPDVEVTGEVEEIEESNKVKIVFKIEEGAQTKVQDILFSGNSFASSSTLKKLLSTKEISLFNNGIFEEGKLIQDKDAILNYYFEWGYIEARIVDVIKEVVSTEDGQNLIAVTFYVEEGRQYIFGGIDFEGNMLFSDEELGEQIRSIPGKILNKRKLEADMIRVTDMYYNDGYIFNDITTEEVRDDEKNQLSFIMHIKEAGRAHIENIIIEGNTKTRDYVILRELPLEVGDIFSKDKIMQGLNNLNNLRYFETFVPETPQGSAPGLMDLIINVEEGRTIDLNFGVTFTMEAGAFPIVGFIKWTDNNFLGKGQQISVGSEVSTSTQNLTFSFNENWLMGRRWSGGLNFSIERSITENIAQDILFPIFTGDPDDNPQMVPDPYDGHWVNASDGSPVASPTSAQIANETVITDYAYAVSQGESINSDYLMDYESFEFSLGGNTGYSIYTSHGRIGMGTGLSTALSYTTYDDSVYRPYNPSIRSELDKWQFINKWSTRVSYDTRDIIYSPNKGYFLSQSLTYTGGVLGGSRNLNKTSTIGEVFFKLFEIPVSDSWNWKSVLAFHSNISFIFNQYSKLEDGSWGKQTNATQSDLLYTDGMVIAKGWPASYNGKALWDSWIELRTPLVPGVVAYNSFLSGTALWDELEDFKSMEFDDFKFTIGTGLQVDIPSFPMGFFFVKRFNFMDNDLNWQPGNVFRNDNEDSGLDFIITFNFSYY